MKTRLTTFFAAVLALAGCAQGVDSLQAIDAEELATIPLGCDALLDTCASAPAVGHISGTDSYLVETSEGRCLSDGPALLDSLRSHGYSDVALRVASDLEQRGDANGDPNPHPGLELKSRPVPAPLGGNVKGDPSPHPGIGDQDDEDIDVVFVVVWVSD